jgi:hypothetical protein
MKTLFVPCWWMLPIVTSVLIGNRIASSAALRNSTERRISTEETSKTGVLEILASRMSAFHNFARMNKKLWRFPVMVLVLAGAGYGQQPCGERVVPVNVALRNGDLLRQLPADVFVAKTEERQISVTNLGEDDGARRVIVVVDTGELDRNVRKAEQVIVRSFVEQLRPEDKVAITTARGIRRNIRFGDDRSVLDSFLADIGNPKGRQDARGLAEELQTLLATEDLKPGDALFVVARDFDQDEPKLDSLQQKILERGVRVIAFQLGPTLAGTIFQTFGTIYPTYGSWSATANDRNLSYLAFNSGGYVVSAALWTPQSSFKLGDQEVRNLQADSINASKAIRKFYRVRFEQPLVKKAATWNLDLRPDIKDQIKKDVVTIYPRVLLPCVVTQVEKRR